MDPTTATALIGAGAILLSPVLGAAAGHVSGRRARRAQAKDLETQIAQRVINMQEDERNKLAKRIEELEAEVATLKARYERELEQVRGERDSLHVEVGQLRAQLAAKEAELTAAKAELAATKREIADLHAVALVQAAPSTPVPTQGGG